MVKITSTILMIFAALQAPVVQCIKLLPIVPKDGSDNTCPSEGKLQAAVDEIQVRIKELALLIQETTVTTTSLPSIPDTTTAVPGNPLCGPGKWRPFFFLDMSNQSQSCPNGWILSTSPYRACTGIVNSYVSTYVQSGGQGYNEVCGMLAGVGVGLADGFFRHSSDNMQSIEQNYMDGVSITYGPAGSRQHICSWSLALGHTRRSPCDTHNSNYQQPFPPSVVGNNYYCSRVPINLNTPVWQGVNCSVDNPCCSHNNPPIFKAQLAATTTQTIELRICNDATTTDERFYLTFGEIYAQ